MAKPRTPAEPRGKYEIDPKSGAGRVAAPELVYGSSPARTTVSATQAAKRFSDLINRAAYQGETFVIERGGKQLCQIGPLEQRECTFGDLVELLSRLPRADEEYLDAVEEHVRSQPPAEPSPWEK